jgi:polygalacturonase
MSVNLSLLGGAGWQFFTDNGTPLAGGLLYTYLAGTSTAATTYTTSAGNVPNSNPIVLNSAGRVQTEIWLTQGVSYKFVLKTSAFITIGTYDNIDGAADPADIYAALAASSGSSLVGFIQSGSGAVATTVQAKLRESVSVKDFGAVGDGVTDDTAAIQAAVASGKSLYFPQPTLFYNITSALSITVPFETGLYQVFGGTGAVTLNAPAYPDWFGTGTDGSTGGAAFNKAALAGTSVRLADKIYNIRDVKLTTAVSIYGDGSNSKLNLVKDISTSSPASFNDAFLIATNAKATPLDFHNFSLSTLTANGAVLGNVFLLYNVDNVSIFNVRIYNTYDNVGGVGMLRVTGLGGSDSTSSSIKIIGCDIESTVQAEAIGLTGVIGCVISNNRLYNVADDAIGLHGALYTPLFYNADVVITGNTVYAGSRCVLLDGYNQNINITANLFTDIGTVTHFMFLTQNPYTTVTAANISSKILLADNVFVSGSSTYEASAIGLTSGNDIIISNNKISDINQLLTGINITPYALISGVQLPLTNVVIEGNVINNAKNGISLNDSSGAYTPQNITVSNNVSTNILAARIGGSATPVAADNWLFSGNNMGDNGPYSIEWTSSLAGLFVYDNGTNNWNLAFDAGNPTAFTATWLAGQRVTRLDPLVTGGYLLSGWVCTVSGTPGTWVVVKTPTP